MSARELQRYAFKRSVPADEIEQSILVSMFAAEGLYGQSRVRLEASYYFDRKKHACVIDVGSDVGRDICRIFTGFAIREFGETSFKVTRAGDAPAKKAEEVSA